MFLPILSAVLGILAFPKSGVYPLGFVFLAPFFIFLVKEKNLPKLLLGATIFRWIFGAGVAFFAFEPFIFLLSGLVFLGLPLSVFLLKNLAKFLINQYFPRFSGNRLLLVNCLLFLLLPFLWTSWDFLQAKFSLLPTFIITAGNVFGSSPFLGLAAIGGLAGLTFFAALVNALSALIILQFLGSRTSRNYAIVGGWASLILILIFGGYLVSKSELKKNALAYQNLPAKFKTALLSNNKKFDKEFNIFKNDTLSAEEKNRAEAIINAVLEPIGTELADKKTDLLILPEDMIDIESWGDIDKEAQSKFGIENAGVLIRAYRRLAEKLNVNLTATITTIRNGKRYNSTVLFNRQGELVDAYDKSSLTILGEYWPFGNWKPFYYALIKNLMPGEIGIGAAVFDGKYAYQKGRLKILKTENLVFGSAICSEIQYPRQIEELKKMGAKFISHTATNRWVVSGLNNFRELTNNLRKIEAVWLKMPILINGREELAGVITPDGKMESVNFESQNKDFGIYIGEIKTD